MWCEKKQWGGRIFFNEGTNRSKGELILVSKHFAGEVNIELELDRILVVSVLYGKHDLIVANVYTPNDSREKISFFLRTYRYCLVTSAKKTFLLHGDSNCVTRNELDIISGLPHRISEVKQFNTLINDLGLKDGWRTFHPGEKDFTWSRLNRFLARRLDYCFVSEKALNSCVACNHVAIPASDHKAVVMELNDQPFQRGPGYWKFNNSLLKNLSFVKMMNERLETVIKGCDSNCSDTDTWELCKVEIRNFCAEFGKRSSTRKRNDLLQCNIQATEAGRELSINPKVQAAHENLLKAKQKIEIIQLDKARGAQPELGLMGLKKGNETQNISAA